jgi:hypothetical protein
MATRGTCFARRRGSSPENLSRNMPRYQAGTGPRQSEGHWVPWVFILGSALGCSRDARAVRLPTVEGDRDTYRISCAHSISPCRDKAVEVCGGDYELLETAGAPVEPPRVSSAPGPSSTGSRYQRPSWVGSIVVACRRAEEAAREPSPSLAPQTVGALRPAQLGPDQLCIPGSTQICLGPGACRGAQACQSDGRGYAVCDCGSASSQGTSPAHVMSDAGSGDLGTPAR